jgi:molybdopterin molybdotransferase
VTVTRLEVAEASAHMLASVTATDIEAVALADALGRVLAEDVVATVALPPRDNASMDGFAVRSADVINASDGAPVRLRVVETIAAGTLPSREVATGEASRIMTGAYVPGGADSVIRVEDTTADGEAVLVRDARDARRNIRARGEDVTPGNVVMRAGVSVGAAHIGVLSSVGRGVVRVHRKPRVAVLATGDELVRIEDFALVERGERIVSSNSYALCAAVRAGGGEPVDLGIAPDDPEKLADCLRRAEGCDLVLTSGGVSVGDFDYTRTVIEALGGVLSLWRVRMRPGAPLGFGRVFGVPWLGLPGNPVSALVTFELFGRPMLRRMSGHARPHRRTIAVTLGQDIQIGAPLTHFLRVVLEPGHDGHPVAYLTGAQSSGMLTSMSAAEALLVVPPDHPMVEAGTQLRALPLDGDLGGGERFLA